ncbi:DUF2252_family protein [Hexamita inflata]|uniref:DUF2252 family protein n=1 Tax=Hexamita inflata TaxID=28002 RepID=A0AA86P3M3_9EUKA|nr:DUF2252 family protein [Hexamita inflata]CAI9930081.1 DUF2252 family protein [Hexamita inflata]
MSTESDYEKQMIQKYKPRNGRNTDTVSIIDDEKVTSFKFAGLITKKLYIESCIYLNFIQAPSQLTELAIDNCQLKYIEGIQQLFNLKSLSLINNYISDISPIQNLKELTYLDLSHNQITYLDSIEQLTNLQILNVSHNSIFDVQSVQHASITKVNLDYNEIIDASPLLQISYADISLHNNKIINFSKLKDLKYYTQHIMLGQFSVQDQRVPSQKEIFDSQFYNANKYFNKYYQKSNDKIKVQQDLIRVKITGTNQRLLQMMQITQIYVQKYLGIQEQ